MMTNGSKQQTGRKYMGVAMNLGNQTANINVTEVPMTKFDAILGGPWLAQEQPGIVWRTNEMSWNGETITPAHMSTSGSTPGSWEFDPT